MLGTGIIFLRDRKNPFLYKESRFDLPSKHKELNFPPRPLGFIYHSPTEITNFPNIQSKIISFDSTYGLDVFLTNQNELILMGDVCRRRTLVDIDLTKAKFKPTLYQIDNVKLEKVYIHDTDYAYILCGIGNDGKLYMLELCKQNLINSKLQMECCDFFNNVTQIDTSFFFIDMEKRSECPFDLAILSDNNLCLFDTQNKNIKMIGSGIKQFTVGENCHVLTTDGNFLRYSSNAFYPVYFDKPGAILNINNYLLVDGLAFNLSKQVKIHILNERIRDIIDCNSNDFLYLLTEDNNVYYYNIHEKTYQLCVDEHGNKLVVATF